MASWSESEVRGNAMACVWYASITRSENTITRPETKIGGLPVFVAAEDWPHCSMCGRALEFWAQIQLDVTPSLNTDYAMAYIFACPSERDVWQRESCNAWQRPDKQRDQVGTVVLQQRMTTPFTPNGEPTLPEYEVQFEPGEEPDGGIVLLAVDTDEARLDRFREGTKLGGSPVWWQTSRSPQCPVCGGTMRFVFQLCTAFNSYAGIDVDGGNFGNGYLFVCERACDSRGALMLWQHA
jgi:hypothetical protein